MTLLIQLLLAHLIGDFLLQPTSWVAAKEQRKIKAYQLYLHALIHGILILLITENIYFWPWALLLTGIHLLIDGTKISLQTEQNKRRYFFYDQIAHLLSILFFWILVIPKSPFLFHQYKFQLLFLGTCLLFITVPTSIGIKLFISQWTPKTEDKAEDSLQNAGKIIGYLERILVFIFIISQHWEAVGFLIAAKSIFRFGDLKASKDRKLTEYVLIGTLSSFGIAILTGMLFRSLSPFL